MYVILHTSIYGIAIGSNNCIARVYTFIRHACAIDMFADNLKYNYIILQ